MSQETKHGPRAEETSLLERQRARESSLALKPGLCEGAEPGGWSSHAFVVRVGGQCPLQPPHLACEESGIK